MPGARFFGHSIFLPTSAMGAYCLAARRHCSHSFCPVGSGLRLLPFFMASQQDPVRFRKLRRLCLILCFSPKEGLPRYRRLYFSLRVRFSSSFFLVSF